MRSTVRSMSSNVVRGLIVHRRSTTRPPSTVVLGAAKPSRTIASAIAVWCASSPWRRKHTIASCAPETTSQPDRERRSASACSASAIPWATASRNAARPKMRIESTGYGAGTREYEGFPNVLRVMIGETRMEPVADEQLWMLETNLDDVSPQISGYVMERAFELGALDCYFTPVQMKKNRPGVLLSILCSATQKEALSDLLFLETTTLGVRSYQVERRALERSMAFLARQIRQ